MKIFRSKTGLLLLLLIVAIFGLTSILSSKQVQADYADNFSDVYTESFNEIDLSKQSTNDCLDLENKKIENCVFLRSVKNGSLYFGNRDKNTYAEGNNRIKGVYNQLNVINIPQNSGSTLKMNHKLEVEKGLDWDVAKITIIEENNTQNNQTIDIKNTILRQTETSFFLEGTSYFDISKFDGKAVKISLEFDTIDEKFNNFFGWEIFDFQVLKSNTPVSSVSSSSSSSSSVSSQNSSSSSQSSSSAVSSNSSTTSSSSVSNNSSSTAISSSQSSVSSSSTANIVNPQNLVWTTSSHENFPNLPNLWRINKTDANNQKLIYNSGNNYATNGRNGGNFTSNEIKVPEKQASQNLTLVLNSDLNVETKAFWDIAKIVIIEKSSGAQSTIWQSKVDKSGQISLDINKFAGKSVFIRFSFDTIDSKNNSTAGWTIDSLRIVKS